MKNKHTPGNWTSGASGGTVYASLNNTTTVICVLEPVPLKITPEIEANANLIAAAPELLQMVYDLKQCIKRLTQDDLTQYERDTEAQWEGEAHALLTRINPDWYSNANEK